jgi:outer membrane protein assembly factor BamB
LLFRDGSDESGGERIGYFSKLANPAQPATMAAMMFRATSLIAATLLSIVSASADWPQFLGPDGNSIVEGKTPLKWSETQNVKWKAAIHGRAWSSPVISGNDIWLSTATEDGKKLSVLRLNKETGEITLDKKLFDIATPQFCHKFNSYASPTPVIEGDRVYVTFGSPGTACLDTKSGEVLWQRTDIECNHYRAAGSSPILYQNLLIMNYDGSDHQFILALNKQSGKTVWNVKRSIDFQDLDEKGEPKAEGDMRKAYGTPHIATIHGKPVLLSVGAKALYGYNPENGKEYFRIESRVGHSSSARPSVVGDMVYYTTGWSKGQFWGFKVNPDLSANQDSVTLQLTRNISRKPIPIVHRDRIYTVDDGGIASCVDRLTGEDIWRERIGGNYSASPLLVGNRLYFQSEDGKTTVVAASDEFQQLAENTLERGFMASPAVDGDALILRTKTHLYRIEE